MPPPDSFTVPVGVMLVPPTATVTFKLASEFSVVDAGVTVIVGVKRATVVTVTVAVLEGTAA
jgi:hypothetical protein